MDRLIASKVFINIVEHGSMIKASEVLNMSRSMVTRYLAAMENWAEARLLHRTTRKLTLTAAGESVLAECYKLQDIEREVRFAANNSDHNPQGTLRIASSQFFSEHVLAVFVNQFLTKYPKVSIDIAVGNHTVNLVEERIDLAIRISNALDPNIIARKFGELNSTICAAPSYIKTRGAPSQIAQLDKHNCLTYSHFNNSEWHFTKTNETETVTVSGNLNANDPAVLLRASLEGLGISLQPKSAVTPLIESGKLVHLLPDYMPQSLGIYGVYQSREYMSKALRVFIDELAEFIAELEL